jgi:hypothetical protein
MLSADRLMDWVTSERFGDGNIGAAVNTGVLQAVVAALAAWYRDRQG